MFHDKVVLVTGAAAGIGRAIAAAFHQAGARVALADRDGDALAAAVDELEDRALAVICDVRDRASVETAFAEVVASLGSVDCLVANAGVSSMKNAMDLTDEDWDFNFDVNAKGVFLTNQVAVRHFLKADNKGCVINTASLAAKVGAPYLAHYSASKFAVLGWTQALAREVACHGIRINAVCPGFVKTAMQAREIVWEATLSGKTPDEVRQSWIDQTPLGRLEEPDDVAGVVVFLASDAARFMTGQAINVTGGVYMS